LVVEEGDIQFLALLLTFFGAAVSVRAFQNFTA